MEHILSTSNHPIFKTLSFEFQPEFSHEDKIIVMTPSDFIAIPEQAMIGWIYSHLGIEKSADGHLTFTDYVRNLIKKYINHALTDSALIGQKQVDETLEKLRLCGVLLSMKKERIERSFAMNLEQRSGLPVFGYLLFNAPQVPFTTSEDFNYMFLEQ